MAIASAFLGFSPKFLLVADLVAAVDLASERISTLLADSIFTPSFRIVFDDVLATLNPILQFSDEYGTSFSLNEIAKKVFHLKRSNESRNSSI